MPFSPKMFLPPVFLPSSSSRERKSSPATALRMIPAMNSPTTRIAAAAIRFGTKSSSLLSMFSSGVVIPLMLSARKMAGTKKRNTTQ